MQTTGFMADQIPSGPKTIAKRVKLCCHQHNQSAFSVWFNSTPSPDTHILLPSGISVSGIETWMRKLADVA